jgi:hypothetical protein
VELRIWHEAWTEDEVLTAERLFFWMTENRNAGVILFPPGSTVHFSRLWQMMEKLAKDAPLREKHFRKLRFPLERHYSEYGVFPEEKANPSTHL